MRDAAHARTARAAVGAAVAGNVLEWYDFAVYSYLASVLGRVFFPSGDATTELLASFAVFGVGFLARPLGGVVIGRLADARGRRDALLLTIFLMAAGTMLIGVAPSYASAGVAAPVLMVIARLLQGFSAGGEWGGSTAFIVEWAPERRRGFYGSLQQCSVAGGLLLGSGAAALLSSVLSAEAMQAWGWRVPFLFGGLLGPVGLYMRRTIEETPAFRRVREAPRDDAHRAPWRAAFLAFGFTIHWTVSYYIFLNFMPTFTQQYARLSSAQALWSNTIGLVALVVAIPVMGAVSDRVGRRPLLLACCAAFVALPYPVARLLVSGPPWSVIVLLQLGLAVIIALFSGAGPAAIAELFPTRSRSTWMTTGYALSTAIFGGFAPYIATWLIRTTGSPVAWVFYVMSAAAVSGLVIWSLEETAHDTLR